MNKWNYGLVGASYALSVTNLSSLVLITLYTFQFELPRASMLEVQAYVKAGYVNALVMATVALPVEIIIVVSGYVSLEC